MDPGLLIDRILDDEGIAAGLDEPEAMLLIRTLSDRARAIATSHSNAEIPHKRLDELCRRARQIADVVVASRDRGDAAAQAIAARNKLNWPGKHADHRDLLKQMLGQLGEE
jgi:hypothetical protein